MTKIPSRSLDSYLSEYAQSHRHVRNIALHTICVPLIAWSTLGFLHSFILYQKFTAAHLGAAAVLVFYASFRKPWLWLTALALLALALASYDLIPELRWTALAVFLVGWIGQFYGHILEGSRPSFAKDLLFLLIGPLWVIHKLAPGLTR